MADSGSAVVAAENDPACRLAVGVNIEHCLQSFEQGAADGLSCVVGGGTADAVSRQFREEERDFPYERGYDLDMLQGFRGHMPVLDSTYVSPAEI